MSHSQEQVLIDYLDNNLQGEEKLRAEQLLRDDAAAATEMEELMLSVDLIREYGVLQQVKEARQEHETAAKGVPMQQKSGGAVVRSFNKTLFRVAAMVVIVLGAASVYKYSATNASSVYNNSFENYEIATSRGANEDGALEKAYRNKDWKGVTSLFATEKEKGIKDFFLAGMASMELKDYAAAASAFNQVNLLNNNNPSPLYKDEAEYYLAMSYLGANQAKQAVPILRKIKADSNHLYYKKAQAISDLDLKLLELKD